MLGRTAEIGSSAASQRAQPRLAVVGVSTGRTCGVRDHAALLAEALTRAGVTCSSHWLDRESQSFRGARAEVSSWASDLARDLESEAPDAVLLHYSVFAYSHRGMPVFVSPIVSTIARTGIPLIVFVHELAYRQRGRPSVQGAVWALSQRAAMLGVMRSAAAAVVTVEDRIQWLSSRVWLPRRQLAFAPVFSTLPPPTAQERGGCEGPLIGIFGYACGPAMAALVLDVVSLLRECGLPVTLRLLGAPGRDSAAGEMWRSQAGSRSLVDALSFSGTLCAQDLSNALAGCDLLLFVDRPGPTSRKTTLAGALASGTAVVAIDGPRSWSRLLGSGALELAAPRPDAVANAVATLLREQRARQEMGARGRAFAEREMGVSLSVAAVAGLLDSHSARATR